MVKAERREKSAEAGMPVKITLKVDCPKISPAWDDVAFVTAIIVDANGVKVPGASDPVSFKITGPGTIAAVDNGDIASVELFEASERRAYQGRCYAMIKARARGKITVSASAPGLASATIKITAVSDKRACK